MSNSPDDVASRGVPATVGGETLTDPSIRGQSKPGARRFDALSADRPAWSSRSKAVVISFAIALIVNRGEPASRRNTDLDRLRLEISRMRVRLSEVHRQAGTAERELEEADLELDIRGRELDLAIDGQNQVGQQQRETEAQIAALTPRIERQKIFLRKRLVALYRMGSLSYLRMFVTIDDRHDPLEAISLLSYLVSRDSRAVSRFQTTQQQLSLRQLDLAERRERLRQMQRNVAERQSALAAARDQKERMLAKLHDEESGSTKQLAELEGKARRLERLVGTLSKTEVPGGTGSSDIRTVQGRLPWPVAGKVVEHFGRQRNAKFSTVTTNNGVKIAAVTGSPVKAVFGGTVLFSQWFKGYGNLVIVDHGNRVFSLYGNVKTPVVAISDRVTAGQAIAGVGEGEDALSGYLYFEIRNDNKPEDPRKWLR